jgi:hypothetical protein
MLCLARVDGGRWLLKDLIQMMTQCCGKAGDMVLAHND